MTSAKKMTVEMVKKLASEDDLKLYSYITDRAELVSREIEKLVKKDSGKKGGGILVYGPQNAGKTIIASMLADYFGENGLSVVVTQPVVDRPDVPKDRLYSRSGIEKKIVSFETKQDLVNIFGKNDVVVVDEIQFVSHEMQTYFLKEARHFVERGGWLVSIGCLHTSQGAEFLLPAILNERSTKSYEVTSTCQKCGGIGARWNQRLVDGKPTSIDDPELLAPSSNVSYEPRCDECHVTFG